MDPQQTLAQRVRAKYPGAYDDMTDQQLEAAVKAKFPGAYDDIATTPEAAPPSSPEQAPTPTHPMAAFGTGVAKGIGRAAGGLMAGAASMFPGINYSPADQAKVEQGTQPQGAGETLGFAAEKAAELAIPSGQAGKAAVNAIPNAARAGESFQKVMGAAKNIPIDVTGPGNVALRIMQLAERGGSMPKSVRDFLKRVTDPEKGAMTYEEARDFASNISRLSANEFGRLTPAVAREVHSLRVALNSSVQKAANQAGMGAEYARAMHEYRRAMKLETAKEGAKKTALKHFPAALGAYWLYDQVGDLFRGR